MEHKTVSDSSCLEQIRDAAVWKSFLLTDNLIARVYGLEINEGSDKRMVGPMIHVDNRNPVIPKIRNGYYYFIDRVSGSGDLNDDSEVLNRNSYNFTIAIYDADAKILYYVEFDI